MTRIGNYIYNYLAFTGFFSQFCASWEIKLWNFFFPRFKVKYESPILRGNDKNASDREKHISSRVAKVMLSCTFKCALYFMI